MNCRRLKPERSLCWTAPTAVAFCIALIVNRSDAADATAAARQVGIGIAKHKAGDFKSAEKAFENAEKQAPSNPIVLFDKACRLAAQGKLELAEELFQQARGSDDREISAASSYNLGCLATSRGKDRFGDKPEDASPETRQQGVALLEQAVNHYRNCLAIDPQRSDARHNLEVLRVWIKHINEIWRQRDLEKRRNELGLIEFLDMIVNQQSDLRTAAADLSVVQDSPRRRQALSETAERQRELVEEIEPLQQKIRDELAGVENPQVNPNPGAAPSTNPQLEAAIKSLTAVAQQARQSMSQAAVELSTNSPKAAIAPQAESLQRLDEIYRSVAPPEHLLRKSLGVEESLLQQTRSSESFGAATDQIAAGQQIETQRQVTGWIESLIAKASQGIKTIEQTAPQQGPPPPPTKANGAAAGDLAPDQQQQQLRAFYEKAAELGPLAKEATIQATDHLQKSEWSLAAKQEQEAVELLNKILESLPKPPEKDQNQDQNKQSNEKQNSESQNNEQQNSQDEQNKQENGDQKEKDRDKPQDSDKSQQQDQQQQDSKKQPAGKPQPSNARDQAEGLLRRVREREREYKQRQKEIQARIRGSIPVDKDW